MIHDAFNCQMLVDLITEWLEGALDAPTRNDLELHVVTCADCLAYVEQMRLTNAALARLDSVEQIGVPSEDKRNELMALFRARRA